MMSRGRRNEAVAGLGIAAGGLFLGHLIDYRIVSPQNAARQYLLAHTGHSYLPRAFLAAALLAAAAVAAAFASGIRSGLRGRAVPPRLASTILKQASGQAVAFIALEAAERLLSGASLADLAGPLLAVGVALQLLAGAAGGLLLFGLERAGRAVGQALSTRPRPAGRLEDAPIPDSAFPEPRLLSAGHGIRGPPPASLPL